MKKIKKVMKKIKPYKGAGVALFQKDSATGEYTIFLGKRKINTGKGKWSIPGGGYEEKKDKGDLRQTAKRELSEETCLNLDGIVLDQEPCEHDFRLPFFTWKTLLYELKPDYKLDPKCIRRAPHGFEFEEAKQIPLSDLKNYDLNFGVNAEVKAFERKIKRK